MLMMSGESVFAQSRYKQLQSTLPITRDWTPL